MLAVCIAFGVYVSDYYHADPAAEDALVSDDVVSVTKQNGNWVFVPESPTAGLIFYPGGKVENTAYAPLLHDLAEDGILCVLVKMPCNLAVLDRNAADSIPERFSEVTDWYIGGHSLGGAMAAVMPGSAVTVHRRAMARPPSLPRNNSGRRRTRWRHG